MKISKKKIYLNVLAVVGIGSITVHVLNLFFEFLTDYLSGFTLSFGVTLIVFYILGQYTKRGIKQLELSENDERLKMISTKKASAGFVFHILLCAVGVIVFGAFDATYYISLGIAGMLALEGVFIAVMGFIYNKKY